MKILLNLQADTNNSYKEFMPVLELENGDDVVFIRISDEERIIAVSKDSLVKALGIL